MTIMTHFRQISTKSRLYRWLLISYISSIASALLIYLIYNLTPPGPKMYREPSFFLVCGLILVYVLLLFIASRFLIQRLHRQTELIAERERQLAEAEKEVMRANLLRAVSHDLRTPLTGIIGNSLAYLENQSYLTDDEKEDLVRNIYDDSTWLINMVENLLSVTRIQGTDLSLSLDEQPVEEVVAEAIQKIQKRHPKSAIQVKIPEEFILLKMDAILIEQVIINLLENALFHSGTSEPVDFIVENHPDHVSFTVRDYGVGIPDAMLNHLFEGKEYTVDSSDVQKGIGIGLVICKTIISAHHGTISGHNHEKGAEFTFTLPK